MVMEAAASAPFIMPKSDLLLELLIIAFDAPAQFGDVDQIAEGDIFCKGRKPVVDRLVLVLGPLDQQPLFHLVFAGRVTMRNANAQARKARGQPVGRAFPPLDRVPSLRTQAQGNLLDRDQIALAAAPPL